MTTGDEDESSHDDNNDESPRGDDDDCSPANEDDYNMTGPWKKSPKKYILQEQSLQK